MKILRSGVWWPNMQSNVEDYIGTCTTCNKKDRNPALNVPTLGRSMSLQYIEVH